MQKQTSDIHTSKKEKDGLPKHIYDYYTQFSKKPMKREVNYASEDSEDEDESSDCSSSSSDGFPVYKSPSPVKKKSHKIKSMR